MWFTISKVVDFIIRPCHIQSHRAASMAGLTGNGWFMVARWLYTESREEKHNPRNAISGQSGGTTAAEWGGVFTRETIGHFPQYKQCRLALEKPEIWFYRADQSLRTLPASTKWLTGTVSCKLVTIKAKDPDMYLNIYEWIIGSQKADSK